MAKAIHSGNAVRASLKLWTVSASSATDRRSPRHELQQRRDAQPDERHLDRADPRRSPARASSMESPDRGCDPLNAPTIHASRPVRCSWPSACRDRAPRAGDPRPGRGRADDPGRARGPTTHRGAGVAGACASQPRVSSGAGTCRPSSAIAWPGSTCSAAACASSPASPRRTSGARRGARSTTLRSSGSEPAYAATRLRTPSRALAGVVVAALAVEAHGLLLGALGEEPRDDAVDVTVPGLGVVLGVVAVAPRDGDGLQRPAAPRRTPRPGPRPGR